MEVRLVHMMSCGAAHLINLLVMDIHYIMESYTSSYNSDGNSN